MEKRKNGKTMANINLSILVLFPIIYWSLSRRIRNLKMLDKIEDFGNHRRREIYDRNFDWMKEKWTNKGNDKQEADSLSHNKSYPRYVSNFKIQGAVDPEKSLTQFSL